MTTVNPDHVLQGVALDPGDNGLQWIPGVGFRPVDLHEDMPLYGCEQLVEVDRCVQGSCAGKWTVGKWALEDVVLPASPLFDLGYVPVYTHVYTHAPPAVWHPRTPFVPFGSPPRYDPPIIVFPPWEPPTDCCVTTTSTPPPEPPPIIPLPPSAALLIGALALLLARKRR